MTARNLSARGTAVAGGIPAAGEPRLLENGRYANRENILEWRQLGAPVGVAVASEDFSLPRKVIYGAGF